MHSRRLFPWLLGCLLFWGAGTAFYAQDASAAGERASRTWDAHLVKQVPGAASAIEAGDAEPFGERLKPQEKICDAPRWITVSADFRAWQTRAAPRVVSDRSGAAPSLIGIVVLLI